MNAVFDLNRWLLYIGKHWNENKKKYLLSLGAIGGLLVLWFSFIMLVNPPRPMTEGVQVVTYYVGLFLTGCLYASLVFSDLSDGPKAINYLLVPASLFEKLLSAILYGVILYFICYTVIFHVVDFTMIKVSNGITSAAAQHDHRITYRAQEMANVFAPKEFGGGDESIYLLLGYFAIQSIFLLGSVYFAKFQYIKTLVSGLVVFLVLVFFVHKVLGSFMPHGSFFKPFTVYRVFDATKGELSVQLPEWLSSILIFLMKYSLAPALWVVAYFRLKEKEVNA
jgi:hypothetical protein